MKNKHILVSGGSRGLGSHIVEHLLDQGAHVSSFARRSTDFVEKMSATYGGQFGFVASDANDIKTLGRFLDGTCEKTGGIHGLVNNAAIGQDHLLVHTAPDIVKSILSTNIEAPILLSRLVLKKMLLQESGGRIVNISSICGLRGYNGLTVYSATKGAMDAFTRSLAHEVSARGVLINSIAPGFFESEMSSVLSCDQLSTIKRRTPTHNLTTADQILPVLDMLLFSDTNITGQTIVVDGGTTA